MEKLKALIDEKYPSMAVFAKDLGVDPTVLSRMLKNGNWKVDRVKLAVELLGIEPKDIPVYFFPKSVAFKAHKERS